MKELFLMLMFLEHLDQLCDVVLSPCILVLDGVAFRLVVLEKVDDALCFLGVHRVVPLFCVYWCNGRRKSE